MPGEDESQQAFAIAGKVLPTKLREAIDSQNYRLLLDVCEACRRTYLVTSTFQKNKEIITVCP